MAKLDLRVRDLKTGETLNAMFESEADALTWLADRPPFMEVLGVATHGLPKDLYATLRSAARPLDAAEAAMSAKIEADEEATMRKADDELRRLEQEEAVAHRAAQLTADPDRPMAIEWTVDGDMHITDSADPRTITEAARSAVLAWVRERDEWVRDRGQIVGEASVSVYPGALPASAGGARVLPGGQFFPAVAAPKQ